jgi:hypothetical protein
MITYDVTPIGNGGTLMVTRRERMEHTVPGLPPDEISSITIKEHEIPFLIEILSEYAT